MDEQLRLFIFSMVFGILGMVLGLYIGLTWN